MRSLEEIVAMNNKAAVREAVELEEGYQKLGYVRVYDANPDLRDRIADALGY